MDGRRGCRCSHCVSSAGGEIDGRYTGWRSTGLSLGERQGALLGSRTVCVLCFGALAVVVVAAALVPGPFKGVSGIVYQHTLGGVEVLSILVASLGVLVGEIRNLEPVPGLVAASDDAHDESLVPPLWLPYARRLSAACRWAMWDWPTDSFPQWTHRDTQWCGYNVFSEFLSSLVRSLLAC